MVSAMLMAALLCACGWPVQVARRVKFSPPQLLQLQLAMRVYARMSRVAAEEGSSVLQSMASLSISRVLEESSGDSNSGCRNNSSKSSAAAHAQQTAADVSNDGAAQIAAINSQLHRRLLLRNIQAQVCNTVMLNHMTKLQVARIFVGELHALLL